MSPGNRTNLGAWVALSVAAIVLGYALLFAANPMARIHRDSRDDVLISVMLAAGLGLLSWFWMLRRRAVFRSDGKLETGILLLLVYAVFQALPLPLALVRILSPSRARLADSLSLVMEKPSWAPLSVAPSATVFHFLVIAACAILFLVVYGIGSRLKEHPWAAAVPLMLLGAGEALLGMVQMTMGEEGNLGLATYSVRNHYAGFLEMVLPFAVLQPISALSTRMPARAEGLPMGPVMRACFGFACAALILAGIFSSGSRMGFLVALATVAVLGLTAFSRGRSWRQMWPAFVAAPGLALLAIIFLSPDQLITRSLEGDISRPMIWRDTVHLIAAYPVFGCGLGGYEPAFLKHKSPNLGAFTIDHAHNDYLQYLAEVGIVGFIIALWPLVIVLGRLRGAWLRPANPGAAWLALASAGSLLAIGLHSLVDFNLYVPANMFVLAWTLGIAAYIAPGRRSSSDAKKTLPPRQFVNR